VDDERVLVSHLAIGRRELSGSDLGRIKRQQKFMSSVVKKALSGDTLTNPIRTFNFLTAATKSVTTDDNRKMLRCFMTLNCAGTF